MVQELSISKSEVEKDVLSVIEAAILPRGFKVVDVDCRVGGMSLLRLFVDRIDPNAPKVMIVDCAEISRSLSDLLDLENEKRKWFPGAYELEVSSPGLERRLRLMSDFTDSVGKEIKVKLLERVEGMGANLTGMLIAMAGETITLEVDKKSVNFPITKVREAHRVWRMAAKG